MIFRKTDEERMAVGKGMHPTRPVKLDGAAALPRLVNEDAHSVEAKEELGQAATRRQQEDIDRDQVEAHGQRGVEEPQRLVTGAQKRLRTRQYTGVWLRI